MSSEQVAVLDIKRHLFLTIDKSSAERAHNAKLDLPRWKPTYKVYLPKGSQDQIATVNLWGLGLAYNIKRMWEGNKQLYIVED
ncbi:hypothetical protein F4810DRAFT_152337 [Camillea tinctor]|nr:hypothetical protein F4810DRAFT_152337 [Camillea tinctor]